MKHLRILILAVLLGLNLAPVARAQTTTVYMYDSIANNWSGNGVGGTFRDLGTDSWQFTRQAAWTGDNFYKVYNQANNTDNNFNQPSGSKVWSGNLTVNASSAATIFAYGDGNGNAGKYSVTNGKHYTFLFKDVATSSDSTGFVFETDNAPVTIASVSQSGCMYSEGVTVNVTLSAAKSSQEKVYIRYTTNNWSNSTALEVTNFGAGTTGSATIPLQSPGTTVNYYVLTTATTLNDNDADADLKTINYANNSGANYSYTVNSPAVVTGSIGKQRTSVTWTATPGGPNLGYYLLTFTHTNNTSAPWCNLYYQVTAATKASLMNQTSGTSGGGVGAKLDVANSVLPNGNNLWDQSEQLTNQQYQVGVTGSGWQLTLAIYTANNSHTRSSGARLLDTIVLDEEQLQGSTHSTFLPVVTR